MLPRGYDELMKRPLSPEVLGPFHPDVIGKQVTGPFGPGVRPGDPEIVETPLLQSMGVTPGDVKALMDAHPEAKDALSQPEAESLRGYLQGNKNYDMHILNNLFAELSDGMRARLSMAKMPAPKPNRYDYRTPRWAVDTGDQSVAPTTTRSNITDVGPAEVGESSNQAPSEWWLEGK